MLTDVERELPYCVTLMEALESVEADGDDVVTVVEKAEMSDDQLLAGLPLAFQMSSSTGDFSREKEKKY